MVEFNTCDVSTVIYLSTLKQIMDTIEFMTNWNQMVFWLTQMIWDNVHIPLLVAQTSDVEENPDLTIIDTIDQQPLCLSTTNQENEALFGENACKHCFALSHDSHQIEEWY